MIENHFSNGLNTADSVYFIDSSRLSVQEYFMIVSLQGIVAQTSSQIMILSKNHEDLKELMVKDYGTRFIRIDSAWELVEKFSGFLNDKGFVSFQVFNKDAGQSPAAASSVSKACTIAGVEKYLMVDESQVSRAEALGLKKKIDAVTDFETEFDVFQKYRNKLNPLYVVHQVYSNPGIRDFGIAMKATFYNAGKENEIKAIYSWMQQNNGDKNGAVLGWYSDEVSGVGLASMYGIMTIPSDHAANVSLYAGLKSAPLHQKPITKHERENKKTHYVTFLLSDGDNVQVHVNGYRNHNYASKQRGTIPFGWSTSPSLFSFAPFIQKYYYDNETGNDDFCAAVSGVGYCNPANLPKPLLNSFAKLTADYFSLNNIETTVVLMDTPEDMLADKNTTEINNLYDISKAYSQYDSIKGGFMYFGYLYCPVLYPGCTFWNNGKPFVGIRETLWHDGPKEQAMHDVANRINNYTKDATKIESYTAINVQYWQYNYDEVVEFCKLLGDDVVVVTPREFIDIMTRNVTDKTTKLVIDDVKK